MALHLITGYAGQEHVTSADQGAYNMGTYGEGEFVLDRGSKFAATVVTNNQINIANGEALMQGRFIKLPVGTTESVTIDNGTSGMKRKDLIVLRYTKNASTGVETVALAVKKGTPSSGTPSDPSVTTGNITDGTDLVNEMKLYRVNLDGLNITAVDTLFSLKTTMVKYMDNYQLPIATDARLGGVKIGDGINVDEAGLINLKKATDSQLGGVKGGANVTINSNGVISVPNGSSFTKGVMSAGTGLNASSGELSLKLATSESLGGVKIGKGLNINSQKLILNNLSKSREAMYISETVTIPANSVAPNPVYFISKSFELDPAKDIILYAAVEPWTQDQVCVIPLKAEIQSDGKIKVTGKIINPKTYSVTLNGGSSASETIYLWCTYLKGIA